MDDADACTGSAARALDILECLGRAIDALLNGILEAFFWS